MIGVIKGNFKLILSLMSVAIVFLACGVFVGKYAFSDGKLENNNESVNDNNVNSNITNNSIETNEITNNYTDSFVINKVDGNWKIDEYTYRYVSYITVH